MTNLDLLLAGLDEAYEKKGWHGTNLRGSLRRVTPQEALWRPAPERHNIWELALHAAYWKYTVRRRLRGEKRGSFTRKGSNWFRSPDLAGEEEWGEVIDLLGREHKQMREAIAGATKKQLEDRKIIQLIYGIAAHDLYHTGQIQLIKRLYRST